MAAIPPLFCPIPSALHPDHESVGKSTELWLETMGFSTDPEQRRRLLAIGAHEFVCRIARDAEGTTGLELVSQWLCSMLTLDDEWDTGELNRDPSRVLTIAATLLAVINSPNSHLHQTDRYGESVRDVFRRAREWAPAPTVRRWADSQLESFMGAATVVAFRAEGKTMSLAEYLTVGPLDRGSRSCIDIIEVCERTCLPQSQLDSPRVHALTQAAKFLVLIAADLYSYRREDSQGALQSNMVDAVQRHLACDRERALHETAALHDRTMCLFLRLADRTSRRAGPELRRYVRQLSNLVSGNLEWGFTSARYAPRQPGTIPVAERADRPADGRLTPPPYPEISWWWDQLW
ncbi:hypothetical protein AB0K51_16075 [Kitasatospora sp. NPDC049285]|uniref:terpene synthase family protein n=1 Tax=Kitasatospora sp. NPDC049285 TaxID=3157096 RepID=UPI003442DB8E